MSDQVSFEVEHTRPVVVVRPHGVLDAYTAPDLRLVLMDCLVDQPTGVVIDTSGLTVTDDLGLTVLGGVVRESERWPGARFAVTGGPEIAEAMGRLGLARAVTLMPTPDAAVALFRTLPEPPTRRDRLMPDRGAPGLARAAVQEFCDQHGVRGDGDAAQLITSELVTNAVVHAGTGIELTLRLEAPLLRIAVHDTGPGEAKITDIVDESSPTGRGLLLVDALAASWGSFVPKSGKVVWATVRVRTAAAAPEIPSDLR